MLLILWIENHRNLVVTVNGLRILLHPSSVSGWLIVMVGNNNTIRFAQNHNINISNDAMKFEENIATNVVLVI